nr:MAG TPA: hypothetical protein [Caudoviricetes sp.]
MPEKRPNFAQKRGKKNAKNAHLGRFLGVFSG